jgi:Lon protease-like protein
MDEALLPLFPLDVVLLPGAPLPLHIFEERYKELVGEVLATNSEFGIVQAGDRGILNIGCTATVEQVTNRYPDGRLDIIVVGRRRFEIILLDEEKAYLRASVNFFADEPDPAGADATRVLARAALEAWRSPEDTSAVDETDPQVSFKIAQSIPDLPLRQTMLSLRSESERLKYLIGFLPTYVAKMRYVTHMKSVAQLNGHGRSTTETQ